METLGAAGVMTQLPISVTPLLDASTSTLESATPGVKLYKDCAAVTPPK